MSSGEEDSGDVPYSQRSEWNDVEPVPQSEEWSVVKIDYSDHFRDVFDYFRAILKSGEVSERALALTEDAIICNPANYTVWQYRRKLLKELNKDLLAEIKFISQFIKKNTKNYQVWHHRQVIVELANHFKDELSFTALTLKEDAKNYHAWQHRQWAIRRFDLWADEVEFTTQMLTEDIRNNSAWNERYYVITRTGEIDKATLADEIKFTLEAIRKAPNNESSWNYLRGLALDSNLSDLKTVPEFCNELYETPPPPQSPENVSSSNSPPTGCRSPHLLSFLIDLDRESMDKYPDDKDKRAQYAHHAIMLCKALRDDYDKIRCNYWEYIHKLILLKWKPNQPKHQQQAQAGAAAETDTGATVAAAAAAGKSEMESSNSSSPGPSSPVGGEAS